MTRLALLRRAIQTHTSLVREAATGRGIDRHLLGLRLMMRPETGERAALFDDPLFDRSQEWKLSTSALSAGDLFRGTGCVNPSFFLEERKLRASDLGLAHHITTGTVSTVSRALRSSQRQRVITQQSRFFADLSGPNLIKFGIESKFSCMETSTAAFQRAITSALREMRQLCSPESMYRDVPAAARL